MKKISLSIILSFAVVMVWSQTSLQNLRCEMLTNPEGIDVTEPRLSWEINYNGRSMMQTAYQILVASTPQKLTNNEGDLWNSGKLASGQSAQVQYAGKLLKSRVECYWKVLVWTNKGDSLWSSTANWSMGLLNYVDWKGRWIGLDRASPWDKEEAIARLSARYFRKEFEAKGVVKKAKLHLMGLGMYELYINGQRIGDQVLAPAPTDYTKGVKINSFDVTAQLKQGLNAIGTILGNGRYYAMRQKYKPYKIKHFGYPKMLLQLELEYENGEKETIVSNETWKVTADGPIRTNNEYDGEEYDANKEMPGWNKTGFADAKWQAAEWVQEPGGTYEAQMNPHMKIMEVLKPASVKRLKANTYILDMGQNMTGWLQLMVKGTKGQAVTLRFAETLQADGSIYTANFRDARSTDVYTLKGGATETWEPRFIYHGFRYVEITNFPGVPTVDNFTGKMVYDELRKSGSFTTNNSVINQVYNNAVWGIAGNYKGMPIDCPQRNERQPWLGDRTTGAYGETFIFENARLYAKWLDDIQQSQKEDGSIPDVAPAFWRYYGDNVTWPSTYLTIAHMLYRQYNDRRSVEKHYPYMKKWMNYMWNKYQTEGLVTKDKYGDWCVPPESPKMIHSQDPNRKTDGVLLSSATYYYLLGIMQQFAGMVNAPDDALAFNKRAEVVKAAFNKGFFDKEKARYSNNTITANLLPLSFDMVDAASKDAVFNQMVSKITGEQNSHISTGVIGTQWLMRGLTDNGQVDLAYTIATNTTYPSWGYMAKNGATTTWELWNGNTADPAMNSGNHVMLLGDLVIWYYENLAGIKSDMDFPGFKKIIMKPSLPKGLNQVDASYQSIQGKIISSWTKTDDAFKWQITVPANTQALVYVPAISADRITDNGSPAKNAEGLQFLRMENGYAVFEVGSGNYTLASALK